MLETKCVGDKFEMLVTKDTISDGFQFFDLSHIDFSNKINNNSSASYLMRSEKSGKASRNRL